MDARRRWDTDMKLNCLGGNEIRDFGGLVRLYRRQCLHMNTNYSLENSWGDLQDLHKTHVCTAPNFKLRILCMKYKALQYQWIFGVVHRGSGGPEFWNSEIRKCCTFHFPHVLRVMEDDFSRAARKMFQNALMNLNVFFKKKARAARKFQKFRGICTFHFPLGACATCLAGDPEIVKLCTLLQWIWFFAVILDKMQVWGTKKCKMHLMFWSVL